MKLCTLFEKLPYLVETKGNMVTEIGELCSDSRKQVDKGLFFCIPGARFDAHDYAPQAVSNGCTALVVDHFVDVDVPQVKVTNVRAAMSRMAAAFYGHPAEKMRLVGVTGTKGKTTTTYMIKSILETAGLKVGLIGTTGNMIGEKRIASNYTTPDPIDLQRDLRAMVDEGVKAVVMEVSAHAIDMFRLDGLSFEVGAYTNLSQDHLDYFGTMENGLFRSTDQGATWTKITSVPDKGPVSGGIVNATLQRVAALALDAGQYLAPLVEQYRIGLAAAHVKGGKQMLVCHSLILLFSQTAPRWRLPVPKQCHPASCSARPLPPAQAGRERG